MDKQELIAAIRAEIALVAEPMPARLQSVDMKELVQSALALRPRRAAFPGRFCLWLYASSVDQPVDGSNIFPSIAEMRRSDLDWDQLVAAKRIALTQRESVAEMASQLAGALYRQSATYLLSLNPRGDPDEVPGLVAYPTTADDESMDWYVLVSQLAELAQAVILLAGFGANVLAELQYLYFSGAHRRELLVLNDEVVYVAGRGPTWPLAQIAKAVEFAAAQAPDPPWYSRRQ